MRVAVIGGGPSGLVTLKYLLTAHEFLPVEPIEVRLFESKDEIGGTFRYRVYEDAELVSSKFLTAFSDFRFSSSDPNFVSAERFCKYLEEYSTQFKLWPHISVSTNVTSIRRREPRGHVVSFSKDRKDEQWECDAVAVCSGLHVKPDIPFLEGVENVPIVLHSSEFKGRSDFGDEKNVMVLGAGETAMDLSYLAVTSRAKSVTMCHREGFFYAPKMLPVPIILSCLNKSPAAQQNIPTDTTVASLFDSAYVHPILQNSSLLWGMYDMWAKNIFWLISGTSDGLDQWVGGISKERFHLSSIFLCKSGKAMPYINAPYRNPSFLSRVRAFLINVPIQETGDRVIDLAPWPKSISQDGVVKFEHSNRPEGVRMRDKIVKPDVLVFCTGYSQSFPFLDNSYPVPLQADRRGIYKSSDPSVGFIGFVRPGMGAIPALSELQAQHWTLSLLDLICSTPPRDIDYKLHMHPGRREYESYGVDHDAYAYQLALDMGSAPSFTQVAGFGFKTAFTWAMGPNFNTKFRLIGPWKWEGANEVMRGELWGVVKESGGWFYLTTYTIIPFMLFGALSTALWIGCGVVDLVLGAVRLIKGKMKIRQAPKRLD